METAPGSSNGERRSTVLLVDDEPSLVEAVGYSLRREGYGVLVAGSGPDALRVARQERPDIVVLDVMLPGVDGLQVCRTLRAESTVPILLLSAKGEAIDRVVGLELGADDYLAKPFAMRELLARIKAMLRRQAMTGGVVAEADALGRGERGDGLGSGEQTSGAVVEDDDLTIDPARRQATVRGAPLALKPKEFDLLLFLMRHPGVIHSRDALLRRVWGYDYPVDTRTVDVHVRWLRRKIERDPSAPERIETVRGFGYRFVSASARSVA